MLSINFVAVIVAAIVAFIVGFLMHGPIAGKLWMRLANIVPTGKEKFSDMVPQMIWNFVANIVIASVLYCVYTVALSSSYFNLTGVMAGIACAFIVWLGFVATMTSMDVIWMGKSFKLWLFDSVSSLLVLVSMGIVIAIW